MLPRALMLTTKNAGEGKGREDARGNIQRPTSNNQHPMNAERGMRNAEREGVGTSNIERRTLEGVATAVCLLLCVIATGCKPPGPRALLDGQNLVERGRYAEAIELLKTATSLLGTNANAWNYLGL